jgi:hypothetical protein
MTVAKTALGLGKGEFQKKLGNIVDTHRVGTKLIGKPRDFVLTACRLSDRFSKVANEPGIEVRVRNMKAGPRQVKVIMLKREDGFEQPVPRGQLVDQLYPPRKTVKHANPEKKHAMAVRGAMRSAVDIQMKDYRKTLQYPLTCYHTEKMIRRGMRMDVDHIVKPFVQLCDEFIEANDLTYCDVPLIGPPNLKRFKDTVLWRAWQLYHECHARLAPSLPKANRGAGSGTYEASEALIGSFAKKDGEDLDIDF